MNLTDLNQEWILNFQTFLDNLICLARVKGILGFRVGGFVAGVRGVGGA